MASLPLKPGRTVVEVVDASGREVCTVPITLTDYESQLFEILTSTLGHFDELKATTIRVAGGWVRDKIMARECHDVDIALDTHTGVHFANLVNDYLGTRGQRVSKIGTIAANPKQSKHLETATVTILGCFVDFVNLRSEKYAEDSRIPAMDFGTPLGDATRRDFTINAMFFNVNTRQIEDFTNMGFRDLQDHLIRTPVDPFATFNDDPLRVLRAVRFASRYGFLLHTDIISAIGSPDVLRSLECKVSRERVGVEMDLMLTGPNPRASLDMLVSLGLLQCFARPRVPLLLPSNAESLGTPLPPAPTAVIAVAASAAATATLLRYGALVVVATCNTLTWLRSSHQHMDVPLVSRLVADEQVTKTLLLAGVLAGFAGTKYVVKAERLDLYARSVVRDAIKRPARDADLVAVLHKGATDFLHLALLRTSSTSTAAGAGMTAVNIGRIDDPTLRVECGHIITEAKESWVACIVLAAAAAQVDEHVAASEWLLDMILVLQGEPALSTAWLTKAVLNGQSFFDVLGLQGKFIGPAMRVQMDLLLVNPELTRDECIATLRAMIAEGKLATSE